ncbi:MAG: hypothetical protein ACD_70C00034G0001 [uncultured bacterium]|nr:MAG: hypothetical protein ACD_70C00034G0001 [uncultured bacterium]OGT26167.1 MAG: hypothetical protein A3B71_06570 [Gammaproteobacteria bacterium RIFCSPHIGHO2_02_FULL_42_43]OGT28108.1 MAG: hypothetical protein A2624_03500 [Gammaproteobacteria bacterium RIFCSPHIGHO2_01_FULL_42_8]OGT52545.1 MAG: hypothetical protein A3E54_06175 [Gammaproteobacteria bacterium RIFCSPHIGHO2_12_FULL_41_25]OGT63143.1 MAG: hypothetical protein A3I77_05980 [Gammaproteobacteria bacterium RIFCSPLOWO2_02_FULL_42_14]OGT
MEKTLILEIIEEQAEMLKSALAGYTRHALSELQTAIKSRQIVVITGIRRSGKSTLLQQILKAHFNQKAFYFSFEDERLIHFTVDDFSILHEALIEFYGEQSTFFLDEIQNIEHWELFIRRLHDRNLKIFITGSNATLLSQELSTRLTGRTIPYILYPFSFSEFIEFTVPALKNKSPTTAVTRGSFSNAFTHYLKLGGMPLHVIEQERSFLIQLYENILYRDIISRYKLTDEKSIRELSLYLISHAASLYTYNKLKNILQLGSMNTVKNYIQYLENSYLYFSIKRFSYALKQQQLAPKKIYCIDSALIDALSFKFSENRGRLLENTVFLELKRQQREVYYYHSNNGLEVDFAIRDGVKITQLIQVCASLENPETEAREVNALLEAMNETKLSSGLILTHDKSKTIKQANKTIRVIPVYQWLLN